MSEKTLKGRRIAIAESRELDVFAAMLERRGAEVLRCPLVSIVDAPDPAPVLHWIRAFIAGACDDFVIFTGEGLRRLLGCIERQEPALKEPFLAALARVRRVTRGPKPARVLRELGLRPDVAAVLPTTQGVIDALRGFELRGRRVGVQLYGTEPNAPLMDFLAAAGAAVHCVAPYVYAGAAEDAEVLHLVALLGSGAIDAIAFTSKAQVERLFAVAAIGGCPEQLAASLANICVAAVGPLVADALAERGVRVDAVPEESYFLKPLTNRLLDILGT